MTAAQQPNLDGAKADARVLLADIKSLSDPARGRAAFTADAVFTVVQPSNTEQKLADALVEAAEQGDQYARQAVHQAVMFFVAHGDPLPERLRNYLAEILILRDYGPRKKAGHKNYLRDQLIQHAVKAVCAHGFNPTRNPASEDHPSGCSIVRDVLAESGVSLSEKAIEKILLNSAKLRRTT
jgi:hypothetical protein